MHVVPSDIIEPLVHISRALDIQTDYQIIMLNVYIYPKILLNSLTI